MKGVHMRKAEARAERWAERLTSTRFAKPPREVLAHAMRTHVWLNVKRPEGSLHEADDLIRIVTQDVPALLAELHRLYEKNGRLAERLRDAEDRPS